MERPTQLERRVPQDRPCAANPDLWFGYVDDDGADGAAKARAYETASIAARAVCLRRCPLAEQRLCAQRAVDHGEEYGVWAGVKLPGGQYRKRSQLAAAHQALRQIAAGDISARQLPENAALLERRQTLALPVVAAVLHLSAARIDPLSAA